ncbi:MAG: hypothetical protein WCQ32_01260 [bacterium]
MNVDAHLKKLFQKTDRVGVAPKLEMLHVAHCKIEGVNFFVHKDRGWEYLLLSLCASVLDDAVLQEQLKNKYPYSIALSAIQPIDRFIEKRYCSILLIDGVFQITAESVHVENFKQVPGLKKTTAKATSLSIAFEELIEKSKIL